MSVVTNFVLILSCSEDDGNEKQGEPHELVKRLSRESGVDLVRVDYLAGGTKYMECSVYEAAQNCANLDDFYKPFQAIPWRDPARVQLLVTRDQEEIFKLIPTADPGPVPEARYVSWQVDGNSNIRIWEGAIGHQRTIAGKTVTVIGIELIPGTTERYALKCVIPAGYQS